MKLYTALAEQLNTKPGPTRNTLADVLGRVLAHLGHVLVYPGVDTNDAYIAAMADVLDDAVLTDNVEDFEVLGVPVEAY